MSALDVNQRDELRAECERVLAWENEGTTKRLWIAFGALRMTLELLDALDDASAE